MVSLADTARIDRDYRQVLSASRRQVIWPFAILVLVAGYLAYAYVEFDISTLLGQSRLDRGVILATDSFAYKIHVERNFDTGETEFSLEGQRNTAFDAPPDWVHVDGNDLVVDLGNGYRATVIERTTTFYSPDWPPIVVHSNGEDVTVDGPLPEWAKIAPKKFEARPTLFRRIQVLRNSVEIHRYFVGWEDFWFEFKSPLHNMSGAELWNLVLHEPRIDAGKPNWLYVASQFWNNAEWQHGDVFVALLETVIMAFLGTALAAMFGLPLAFLAARNFNPIGVSRFALRRLFDFLRGIDSLIWSLVFIRAFGLGPLSGIMAIFFTDTGTLGKLFSEAIENIDNRQIEGVQSTGARAVQRYRFGVVPQILPVFVSQSLYYLESNTRSATVIGALGAGGIGLKLVETLRTGSDWENTLYIIVLTIAVVMAMDVFSGWLRRRLLSSGERSIINAPRGSRAPR